MTHQTFRNPVISGFAPDPTICRVGEDYYLTVSTFEYFPGMPVFHSRDLVHWRCLGHILDRPSQLDLDRAETKQGIYAPTIRHHDGTFYVVTTVRTQHGDSFRDNNFIVHTTDPAGDWSDPITLVDEPGIIDPTLFFDDDGRAWYAANLRVEAEPYPGYRDIWLQELDLETMELIGARTLLWNGALKEAMAPEAPHIYKVNGTYYLMLAEGGTYHEHAVTIARSNSLDGPYEGHHGNPILTHRHLGLKAPITSTGHADLVDTPAGDWWMVALACRPYGGYFYNLGRETFLTPVEWEEGWPVVNPGHGRIREVERAPDLKSHPWPSAPACDHFDQKVLASCWNFIRTPRAMWYSLTERPGFLRLRLRPERISEAVNSSFVGRRQQHIHCAVRAAVEFDPAVANECTGLVLRQNEDNQLCFVCQDGQVILTERRHGEERRHGAVPVAGKRHYLKVEARGQEYSFYYAARPESWRPVAEQVDGRVLSTQVADGFVGACIGMYASSNGQPSASCADFDWFEYAPISE